MPDPLSYVQKSIQLNRAEAREVMDMAVVERRSFSTMAGILMQEGLTARKGKNEESTDQKAS